MRICCVGFPFNFPTARRLLNFFQYMGEKEDIEVHIVTVKNWNGYTLPGLKKYNSSNFKVHLLDTFHLDLSKEHSQHKFLYKGLYSKLKEIKPDIVYASGEPIALCNFQLAFVSKLLGFKIGYHCFENIDFKHPFFINWMEQYTLRNADFLVAGTKQIKQIYIGRKVPSRKLSILPGEAGLDTGFYKPIKGHLKIKDKIPSLKKLKKEKTAVFIGRIIEVKGIRVLLNAAEILEKKNPDCTIVIVGFGKLNDSRLVDTVKSFAKVHNNVILIEEGLESKYIPEAYNMSSILAYPSVPSKAWKEQFGYSLIEAMSCGIPVISTYSGGPSTIIEDGKNGYLIRPNNAEALANKINSLLKNNTLRKKMGLYARDYVVKKYGIPTISKKLYSKFKEIAGRG